MSQKINAEAELDLNSIGQRYILQCSRKECVIYYAENAKQRKGKPNLILVKVICLIYVRK